MRVVLFVLAITGVFAAALVYGGKHVGAWEEADAPPPSNQAPILRSEDDEERKDESRGGEEEETEASEKPSPEQVRWAQAANDLCRRAEADMGSFEEPETVDEAEKLLVELQRKNEQYNDAFAALTPAQEDRREVAKLLELFEKDERLLAAVLAALRAGDAGALLELNDRLLAVGRQERDILIGLGATDCDFDFGEAVY